MHHTKKCWVRQLPQLWGKPSRYETFGLKSATTPTAARHLHRTYVALFRGLTSTLYSRAFSDAFFFCFYLCLFHGLGCAQVCTSKTKLSRSGKTSSRGSSAVPDLPPSSATTLSPSTPRTFLGDHTGAAAAPAGATPTSEPPKTIEKTQNPSNKLYKGAAEATAIAAIAAVAAAAAVVEPA